MMMHSYFTNIYVNYCVLEVIFNYATNEIWPSSLLDAACDFLDLSETWCKIKLTWLWGFVEHTNLFQLLLGMMFVRKRWEEMLQDVDSSVPPPHRARGVTDALLQWLHVLFFCFCLLKESPHSAWFYSLTWQRVSGEGDVSAEQWQQQSRGVHRHFSAKLHRVFVHFYYILE